MDAKAWQTNDRFLELRSPWITIIGEYLQDSQGQVLEYWRIEKANSIIVLPIHDRHLLLPPPTYRPGLGKSTWDFPGGRAPAGREPHDIAYNILKQELGVADEGIASLAPLNNQGWAVNSSFSNQRLYGFVANLQSTIEILPDFIGAKYPTTKEGVQSLLNSLTCLQCRALLMEWKHHYKLDRPNE
jgi:hypothetical protein